MIENALPLYTRRTTIDAYNFCIELRYSFDGNPGDVAAYINGTHVGPPRRTVGMAMMDVDMAMDDLFNHRRALMIAQSIAV